ncbi:MAG: glycerol-3-phosphate 1-O-acyltransferase PlsY [Treponema sp.]|nr:glycerol-3-phosphate 1-O-acyltransferase PlsY [Treponema sp.]MCR5620764.1 glycerol-3-phosphate 1-O-acyltransferase PlsY [Treponema sp.]
MERIIPTCIICALAAYLISGLNPAIVLSRLLYHEDIRDKGSGNPGFTNFNRVYGKTAWLVFILDVGKGVLLCLAGAILFQRQGLPFQLGASFTGFFAMLGHCYPVWYRFKGGKAFLVAVAAIFLMDWRIGLIAAAILCAILFTVKYMSLATMLAAAACPPLLFFFGYESVWVPVICTASVLLLIFRHKENIKRLLTGTETKFKFK